MTDPQDMTDAELSEAVAVEVMGWVNDTERGGAPKTTWAFWREPETPGGTFWHDSPPPYATDIAAAMEVFEKVARQHTMTIAEVTLGLRDDLSDASKPWFVFFGEGPSSGPEFYVHEETPMRAICKAALYWARRGDCRAEYSPALGKES